MITKSFQFKPLTPYQLLHIEGDYTAQNEFPYPTDETDSNDENILLNVDIDMTPLKNLHFICIGKKKTDVSDNNTITVYIDNTDDICSRSFADTNEVGKWASGDLSSYYGIHNIKVVIEGGLDWQFIRLLEVWVTRG